MKNIIIILISLTPFLIYGQNDFFSIQEIKKGEDFSFPILKTTSDNEATNKINQFLQISELEMLKGYEDSNIFEHVSENDGTIYGGKTSLNYSIESNNAKILSLIFQEVSCGITCSYWINHYNFNPKNGDLIQLKDLFTENGFKYFKNTIAKKRTIAFKETIKDFKKETRENLEYVVSCYQEDNLENFFIKNDNIYIEGLNCFNKHDKFYDIETILKITLKEFQTYLNDYGKALFSISNESIIHYRSNSIHQLFSGTIAGQNVLLVLKPTYENNVMAEYVYLKYGKGIFLKGEFNNNLLTLTELDKEFNEIAKIEATFDKNKIMGSWISVDKNKKI